MADLSFDAFGMPAYVSGARTPFGWGGGAGYQSDPDTGLLLLGHRYYDPSVGRFLSQDPAGAGDNWYAYCDNDPLGDVDPTGLAPMGAPVPHAGDIFGQMAAAWGEIDYSYAVSYRLQLSTFGRVNTYHDAQGNLWSTWQFLGSIPLGSILFVQYQGFDHNQRQEIKRDLNIIAKTKRGKTLVQRLNAPKRRYVIFNGEGDPAVDDRDGGYTLGDELGIDLGMHPLIDTVDGQISASSLRILAHELGHLVGGYPGLDYGPGPGYNVLRNENPIMTELAGPGAARTSYH